MAGPIATLAVRLSAQIGEFQKAFEDATASTNKFDQKFAGVASSVQGQADRIKKSFAAFSGDTIIRDANAMAAAIEKIGGAFKLTASEQARVNATVTEAIAKYTALGQTAPAAIQNLAKATAAIPPIKNPFTGTDLLNQANNFVKAVEQIGGVSKLTAAEQEKVNKTVTDAIAKYSALGIAAPKSLQDIAKATAQIKPLPDNLFSGSAVIGQAKQYADAVAQIGGASKLTAAEQRTVNGVMTEALAKYKALGQDAPKAIRDVANATKEIVPPTTLAQKALAGLHSTFGQFTLATLAAGAITKTFSLIGDAIRGLGGLIGDAVEKSSEFNNAFLGLGGTAAAFGQDVGKVKEAAKLLSSDGLLPLKDSATSLKNLLASGFGLDQSVKLIQAFKDSAAFGRQSALTFGDAVRSATEGVKNQNSILVDNAGVTKNLSVILKEAGFTLQDLSDKTKGLGARQALYNGILRETAAQQGDAAKAANTYTGQLTAMKTAYDGLLSTWGDAITQNRTVADALKFVGEAFRGLGAHLADNQRAFNLVSDAVIGFVRLLAGVARAIDLANQAFNGMDTALRGTVKGLADAVKAIGELLLGIVAIATKLPGGTAALGIAVEEISSLIIVTAKAGEVSRTMADGMQRNEDRVNSWHKALGGTAASLDALAGDLEKTRGQMVDFGAATPTKPLSALATAAGDGVDALKGFGKELAKLTAQIDLARAQGTPLATMVDLFGKAASTASEKAHAWGITVKASVEQIAQAFDKADLAKEMQFVSRAVLKLNDDLADFSTKEMQKEFADLAKIAKAAIDDVDDRLTTLFAKQNQQDLELNVLNTPLNVAGLGFGLGALGFTPGQLASFGLFGQQAAKATTEPFRDAFRKLGDDLPQMILGALQGGGSVLASVAQGIATVLGNSFKQAFEKALADVGGDLDKLGFKAKALGTLGVGLQAFTSGFAIGDAAGSKGKGALGGAGAGAVAGLPLAAATGGLSVAIGAGIGAIGGFFGGRAAEREAKAALEQSKIALAAQFGGLEKLRTLAEKLGVNIQQAFDAKKPEQFQAAVDKLNAAIDDQNKRIEGLNRALAAVNERAGTFAKQFDGLDKDAIAAVAVRAQPEFDRLGLSIRDTVAGLIKENGDAFGAIEALAPAFDTLKKGVSEFGLTGNAVIDGLLSDFDLINSEITGPFLKNVQESGAIFKGLFDAKSLSPEGFQALAADIGQSLQEVANRGGDISKALALSQPVLQSLWEAQQTFGGITDQTTQSILDQAEAQGIVGAQFKSTQDKTLEVLLAIAHVFHADIPEGIETTARAATTAAGTIGSAFGGTIDVIDDRIRTGIGGAFKDVIPIADHAGEDIRIAMGGAVDDTARNIDFKIGRSLSGLPGKAGTAADGIERALSGIDIPPIPIKIDLDTSDFDRIPDDIRIRTSIELPDDVPTLGSGGIVRSRTLAIIGERGPEAVVPLNGGGSLPTPEGIRVVFEQDGRAAAEFIVPHIPGVVQRYRLA